MAFLFLDFDGVLHPEHCHESRHFTCLSVLEEALRRVPQWQVVITSAWRRHKSLDELRARFSSSKSALKQAVKRASPAPCNACTMRMVRNTRVLWVKVRFRSLSM